MDRDGHPFWPFWDNVRSWWAIRDLPNVRFVHFNDLKRDMPGEMRRIAAFLDIPIDERAGRRSSSYCSFDWMKRNATKSVPARRRLLGRAAPRCSSTRASTAAGARC